MKKGYQVLKRMLSLVMVFAMVLAMAPMPVFAANSVSGGNIYFDNTKTGWKDPYIYFVIGHNTYSSLYEMKKVEGNLYQAQLPEWSGSTYYAIIGTSNSWGSGNWGPSNLTNAAHYTAAYTGEYGLNANNNYVFAPQGKDNGTALTIGWYSTTPYAISVSGTENGVVTVSKTVAEKNNEISLTVTPDDGYELKELTVMNGTSKVNVTDNKFTMPAGNVTVSATFQKLPAEYSVTFNGPNVTSDGAATATEGTAYTATLTANNNYTLPDTVTVTVGDTPLAGTDYTYDSTTGKLEIPAGKVNGNIAISATAVALYTVEFNSNGGTAVGDQTIKHGGTATKPDDPTKDDHTFAGWYSDSELTTIYNFNTAVTGNVTLYAKWTKVVPDTYTVTFNTDGGSEVQTQTVEKDKTATKPADPTKEGHTFDGWYSNSELTTIYDFNTPVTGNVALYAKWTANQYTVTFNSNEGTAVGSQTIEHGKTATQPEDPTKEGCTFGGWYSDAALSTEYDFTTPVTANVNLHAKWEPITYTVKFNSNQGSAVADQTIAYNGQAAKPEDPTKEGHEFAGWYSDEELTKAYEFDAVVTESMTLYAKWDVKMITVYFQNNWKWTDVRIYSWTGEDSSKVEHTGTWPGLRMTDVETDANGYEVYKAEIPYGCSFIFNGIKDNGSGDRDQSPDMSGAADGNAYYMDWDGEKNQCITFEYTPPVEGEKETYTAIFHFANTLNWSPVNLYVWNDDGATLGDWPGTALSQDPNTGYHTVTVTYESSNNKGLNYIFNNGANQTVDLKLDATLFDATSNIAEVWVELNPTPDANQENKYVTKQVATADFGIVLAVSPKIDGKKVTFEYKDPNATSVEVRGTMTDTSWAGIAMTKKDPDNWKGIWTATVGDLDPGVYEYKFVVNGSDWVKDPANGKSIGDNSAFTIVDPNAKDENKITINIYYERADGTYEVTQTDSTVARWNAYVWGDSMAGTRKDFTEDAEGKMTTSLTVVGRDTQYVALKTRLSSEAKEWIKEESEVRVDLADIVSGTINVYIKSAGENGEAGTLSYSVVSGTDIVTGNKVTDVQLDYDKNTIKVTTLNPVANPATEILLHNVNGSENAAEITGIAVSGNTYTLSLDTELDLVTLYQYKILFGIKDSTATTDAAKYYQYDVDISSVYASKKFANEFTYTGDDLGATYSKDGTTFKVWAPTAESVNVLLYAAGNGGEKTGTHAMTKGENGVWYVTVAGNLNGTYYTYEVTRDDETIEAVDPYARTTGVNGNRGMVIDLDSTDPEGWSDTVNDNPNKINSYTDAIIYELHVRDFSIDDSSGVKDEWQGKFLGLTQTGTTTSNGATTGLDYLKNLGITHLHLLPIYDYASVDETTCSTFNWGYDPQNYNVPEGSYSTDPYNGKVRVEEMKEMVDTLHKNNISVIMDVVYNHVYNADTFCFNQIVPGYFSRVDSNTSGCGNDTASEREMVRKYIVDSVLYWAKEYHIDGFRFDLVGLLDTVTINQIVEAVHKYDPTIIFYGEGWDMDGTNKEPGTEMAKQHNSSKTPGFAYFSDSMRNNLGGSNGSSTGFASGAGNASTIAGDWIANAVTWGSVWTTNPQQVVQYASCHDNYTLVDKLVLSTGRGGLDSTIVKMNNLAAAFYMTAQGIPFIHAGEEFLREKLEEDGGRCENSYNASDYVNHIEWSNLENSTYAANVAYYKGLIAFRKAHPVLRLSSASDVAARVINQQASDNVVSFWLNSKGVTGETVESVYVVFNANSNARTITLPEGEWNVCVDGKNAGTETLYTASGTVSVSGISAMILTQETAVETPAAKSSYALPGSFNDWNQASYMNNGSTQNTVTATLSLPAGTYTFKIKNGDDWYGNGGTIDDTTTATSDVGWEMKTSDGDCTLKATGGAYTFTFNTDTKMLVITYDSNGGTFGDPNKYYLCGYIDGEDYAMGMDTGAYAFDENGKLTTTFTRDSYVLVKNGTNSEWYWTNGWLGSVTSATLYNAVSVSDPANNGYDKLMVPGGVEVTFTLGHNNDDTVTLTYTTKSEAVTDTSGIQDGVTLHCWNWSFAEIENNMASIAAQGYTAIQTSPVQVLKEATNLNTNSVGEHWWVYYQPVDFKITTDSGNALGTKDELARMIETAHAYGIQVIVDVVANHLGNQNGNDLSTAIPAEIRNNSAYWHNISRNIDNYSDRQQVTQFCMSGLPDLNTANGTVQTYVLNFLKECIDIGVDGFRFDAAKHIETPEDDIFYASDFWPTVVGGAESYAKTSRGIDLYVYGEVLDIIEGVSTSAYTDYMAITDNAWGDTLRENISAGTAAMATGYNKAAAASNLVIWAESHDTYANDNGASKDETVDEINKTWALVAARADAMGLYLARPEKMDQAIGLASVTGWNDPEVAAVNKFHNAFVGQGETLGVSGKIAYVVRGTTGVVLVNAGGTTAKITALDVGMTDGTYMDQISGNTFTVANGKISGDIGDTGIAVVYMPTEYVAEVENATSGSATVSNASPEAGEIVTITAVPDEGCKVVGVTVTVKDQDNKVVPVTENSDGTFTYVQPNSDVTIQVEFKADYRVVEGDGSTADLDKSETLRFKVNAAFKKFVGIQINGKDVDTANYTVSEGSTIVVLKAEYLKTLPSGENSITFRFTDGSAAGTFKLAKASTETTAPSDPTTETTAPSDPTTETTAPGDPTTETTAPGGSTTETTAPETSATETTSSETKPSTGTTPPTGDNSNIFLWSMLALFSAAAAAAVVTMRKRIGTEE